MRFTDLMAEFFSREPEANGTYSLSGAPPGSAVQALNIEELALFSVIDLISSVGAMCEWRFYKDRKRVERDDWYTWNISPNPDQNGAEFKRLLDARMLRFNEALVFEQDKNYYIAETFSREQDGFRPAVYTGVSYRGQSVTRGLREDEVMHFRLAASGQASALQNDIRGLYSAAMQEAWDKYRKSGGKSGILKVGTQARGKPSFEKDYETLMNDRFKRFFDAKNAVLPLFDGYEYVPQNGPSSQKSTSEVSDIGALLQQAQVSACNPYHVPPSILRGEVTNLEDAVNSMLTFAVKPLLKTVEAEYNRKMYGKNGMFDGWRMQISTVGIKSVDILAQAANAEKLVQNRLYNSNGVREIFGDEPIPEKWADEYVITKNVETTSTGKEQ